VSHLTKRTPDSSEPIRITEQEAQDMAETKKQVSQEETERELNEQEAAQVAGGFNPQPDPPRPQN
jgi:hypothetical protein